MRLDVTVSDSSKKNEEDRPNIREVKLEDERRKLEVRKKNRGEDQTYRIEQRKHYTNQ